MKIYHTTTQLEKQAEISSYHATLAGAVAAIRRRTEQVRDRADYQAALDDIVHAATGPGGDFPWVASLAQAGRRQYTLIFHSPSFTYHLVEVDLLGLDGETRQKIYRVHVQTQAPDGTSCPKIRQCYQSCLPGACLTASEWIHESGIDLNHPAVSDATALLASLEAGEIDFNQVGGYGSERERYRYFCSSDSTVIFNIAEIFVAPALAVDPD